VLTDIGPYPEKTVRRFILTHLCQVEARNPAEFYIRLVAMGIIKGQKGPFFPTLLTPRNKSIENKPI
jgi:hypothetical protein